MPKVDTPEIPQAPKEEFEYVTVPDTDLFDQPHPGVRINGVHFGPGTHKISDPILAATGKERLQAHSRSDVRILQPKRDAEALRVTNMGRGENWNSN
jgi:hypothetical protein